MLSVVGLAALARPQSISSLIQTGPGVQHSTCCCADGYNCGQLNSSFKFLCYVKDLDKLALLPSVFYVGDRLKVDKHKAWSIRPGATTPLLLLNWQPDGRVNDHEYRGSQILGDFNGVSGRREQPKQCPRTYNRIQYSNRPDLQKKSRKKSSFLIPSLNQHSGRNQATRLQIQNQYKNIINSNINFQSQSVT